jgi:DNA replication protein DnaC
MTEELAQLLKALRLRKIGEILDEELKNADKQDMSYQELLVRLFRAQWHFQQQSALTWRIERARMPEKWTLESFPSRSSLVFHRNRSADLPSSSLSARRRTWFS